MTQKVTKPSEDPATLESQAATLSTEIDALDEQIKALNTQRTAKHKELRSITSKLVTIKLKSK